MIFPEETYGLFRTLICPFSMRLCRIISHPLKMGDFRPKAENDPKIPYLRKCPWRCHHGAHRMCHLEDAPTRHVTSSPTSIVDALIDRPATLPPTLLSQGKPSLSSRSSLFR